MREISTARLTLGLLSRDGTALSAQHSVLELWSRRNSSHARQYQRQRPSLHPYWYPCLQANCKHSCVLISPVPAKSQSTELVVSSSKSSPDLCSVSYILCLPVKRAQSVLSPSPTAHSCAKRGQGFPALTPQFPLKCRVRHLLMFCFYFLFSLLLKRTFCDGGIDGNQHSAMHCNATCIWKSK